MKINMILLLGALLLLTVACTTQTDTQAVDTPTHPVNDGVEATSTAWFDIPLNDVYGNNIDLRNAGKPVLIESFAIWCPTCLKQQKEVNAAHEALGDSFISIALDTDPNEDVGAVRAYAEKNGLDLTYAVSPRELTKALIDEFGVTAVQAPLAPMILVCGDKATFLRTGVKKSDELQSLIAECTV
jgi:thiol-disulfide isomerase/thioredoxin